MKTEKQREEIWKKIIYLEYNIWYKWIKGRGIPEHLKQGWGECRWRRVTRCKLGNEGK